MDETHFRALHFRVFQRRSESKFVRLLMRSINTPLAHITLTYLPTKGLEDGKRYNDALLENADFRRRKKSYGNCAELNYLDKLLPQNLYEIAGRPLMR
jgi:hypothetical protein